MQAPEELLGHGFRLIAQWTLDGQGIRLTTIDWGESGGWLYMFVVDGAVEYIGLTGGVLRTRLDQYRDGKDAYGHETQCGRIKAAIANQLKAHRVVEIYGLKKPFCTKEVLASEEKRLISAYRDSGLWNRI
jgi:hypothetical protein